MLEQFVDCGLSFKQIRNIIKDQYQNTFHRFKGDVVLSKSCGVAYEQKDLYFPQFSADLFPHLSVDLLINVFVKRFLQNEELYKIH